MEARDSGLENGEWGMGTRDWRLGAREWGMGNGGWRLGTRDWGLRIGSREPTAESRKPIAGSRQRLFLQPGCFLTYFL